MSDGPREGQSFSDWEEEEHHRANGTLPVEEPEPTEPHTPIEFPSSPIRADTDKPKKRRRKKSNQLGMFGE